MVWRSSFQSQWSEMTSGSSTRLWRARCFTLIQPDAMASTGSARRRLQRSFRADGGAMMILPASSPLAVPVAGAQLAQRHAALFVEVAQAHHGAMQVDRVVIAAFADEGDHALGLAERVAADDVRAIGLLGERTQQPRRLGLGIGMLEDRQAERRLGDEQVACDEFERLGRAVVQALVIAGDDDALALVLQQHLGAAEDVAGGIERDGYAVDLQGLAELQGLERARRSFRRSASS